MKVGKWTVVIGFIITLFLSSVYFINKFKESIDYNRQLLVVLENTTLKTIIEKDVKDAVRGMRTAKKLEGLWWVDLTEDEIRDISIEMMIGELYYKIPHKKVLAYIAAESEFNKKVISKRGAVGIMQIMPDTKSMVLYILEETERGRFHVGQNIKCGIKYINLVKFRLQYGSTELKGLGRPPTIEEELWAYNAGFGNVLRNKWVDYPEDVYDEAKTHVKKFNFYYNNYRKNIYDIYFYRPHKRYYSLDK